MEYYSAIKNNGIMKFVSKWMELENFSLSEVTQTHKDTQSMYSLMSGHYQNNHATIHRPREIRQRGESRGHPFVSLGKENKTDFTSELGGRKEVGWDAGKEWKESRER